MMDLKAQLAAVGDDYLIGLANKGIVKRAYKDKEETVSEILSLGEEASVKVGEETVTIRMPLGESRCTCPSRSICRHVILGILVLKEACGQQSQQASPTGTAEEQASGQQSQQASQAGAAEARVPGQQSQQANQAETAATQSSGQQSQQASPTGTAEEQASGQQPQQANQAGVGATQNSMQQQSQQEVQAPADDAAPAGSAPAAATDDSAPQISKVGGTSAPQASVPQEQEDMARALSREIAAYPLSTLRKAMGARNYQTFLKQKKSGERARITRSSVAVVQLPGDAWRVTLISPLEYSSCTCHKKGLCPHKAEAILWCKLEEGSTTEEELSAELLESPGFQLHEIREAAEQMKRFLLELMETGLPRTSPEILNNLERLALVAHQAALANFEGYFRALQESYQKYLKRVASFQTRDLLTQIARLYRRVSILLETESAEEIARLAGEFRAEYLEVGNLDLKGAAVRDFESKSGYAGKTIYLLEENTQEWYTYTMARPMFYDNKNRRGNPGRSPAPWGLEMTLEDMARAAFRLTGAKCDERKRLSSSQESRAEAKSVEDSIPFQETKWYYQDFRKLFQERIRKKDDWLREQEDSLREEQVLVFLQPSFCKKAVFDDKAQKLTLSLFDGAGREVTVELTYSRKEDWGIRYLERVNPERPPCIFGRIYLRDGKICMYPIAVIDLPEGSRKTPVVPSGGQQDPEDSRKTSVVPAEGQQDPEGSRKTSIVPAGGQPDGGEADQQVSQNLPEKKKPELSAGDEPSARSQAGRVLANFLEEILMTLEITLQSGFDTPADAALEEMEKLSGLAGQYGMGYLEKTLGDLCADLRGRRHRMKKESGGERERPADILCGLMEYVTLCREKAAYDMAAENYDKREETL